MVEMRSISPSGFGVGERGGELTAVAHMFDLSSVLEFGMPLGSAVFNIEFPVSSEFPLRGVMSKKSGSSAPHKLGPPSVFLSFWTLDFWKYNASGSQLPL